MEKIPDVGPILYADRIIEQFRDIGFSEPLVVEEVEGVDDMGAWEDEVGMRRKDRPRDVHGVFHCYAILGMAHFSSCFSVHESSTQQASFQWGDIKICILLLPLLVFLGFVGDPLGLRSA